MKKVRVSRLTDRGRCRFCERLLSPNREESRGQCGRCDEAGQVVKRYKGR